MPASLVYMALQHNNTNSTHLVLIGQVLPIDTSRDRRRTVVVNIVVELTVTGAELELFKEEGVVVEGEGVEDVEFGLVIVSSCVP